MSRTRIKLEIVFAAVAVMVCEHAARIVSAEDWPMLGRDGTRNAVSAEAGAPLRWNIEERNETKVTHDSSGIRWAARLGSQTHSSPVVSSGLVWIGTNSQRPGDNFQALNSVLKCFRVSDGKQVYEYVSQKLGPRVHDVGWTGLGSSPLIEGDRLWLMTNRSEVLCLDIGPLLRDEGPPRELWKQDLIKAFDVFVHVPLMGPPPTCSIGPSWNGRIFVTINNGVDESRMKVPRPDAPSLVCLNKENGEVLWKDNSPGANVLLTQTSSPTVAEIAGRVQVIVPQGDGWVRAFDPESGEKLWEFDINPKTSHYSIVRNFNRNWILGNAVVYENRVYIASGRDAEQGEGLGRLVCIDPTKRGDVSSELAVDAESRPLPVRRIQAVVLKDGETAIPNPNSALVWEFVSCGKKFEDIMHRTMSSVAISKGLVIATDVAGLVHCLDAKSGKRHWSFDLFASIWCSPLIVDDNIYIGDEDGKMAIFGLSADPNVAIQKNIGIDEPLSTIAMQQSILSSPSFANGVLYLATRSTLFAIAADEPEKHEPKILKVPAPITEVEAKERTPRSVYVPTPQDIVEKMLKLAAVRRSDVVYDLGSGDGRIVITAAQKYECHAVGYELDKELVESSRAKAKEANVAELVTIEHQDLFSADLSKADVVMLYLLPAQLEKLVPQLSKMKPGTRVVSHQYEIPGFPAVLMVKPESTDDGIKHTLYVWTSPLKNANRNENE